MIDPSATGTPVVAPRLTATRRRLDPGPPIDPYALAGPTGIVFDTGARLLVGTGTALAIRLGAGLGPVDVRTGSAPDLDRVRRALAAIDCHDEVGPDGSGVMAFGALPFDRSGPTVLIVPEVLYCRQDGDEWVTVTSRAGTIGVGAAGRPADGEPAPPSSHGLRAWLMARAAGEGGQVGTGSGRQLGDAPATGPTLPPFVEPLTTDAHFLGIVGAAVRAIERGELQKVVLARQLDVHPRSPVDVPALLGRWRVLEPSCTVFSMPTSDGQFVGASPELLVERRGASVRSWPLAGTAGRSPDRGGQAADQPDDQPDDRPVGRPVGRDSGGLLDSSKDAVEHRLVADAIGDTLAPLCSSLDVPPHPDLVHLHNVTHLGTAITGTLRPVAGGEVPTALELAAVLHPTPAVGGVPVAAALEAIGRLEPQPRGSYAGPVGYVDARGDGVWMVGIRAATINGDSVRLAAGVGIVPGSDPRSELHETNLKFTAVFDALAPDDTFSTVAGQAG